MFFLTVKPQAIVDGFDQILARAKVLFGSLNEGMPEQKLYLLEIGTSGAALFSARAPTLRPSY